MSSPSPGPTSAALSGLLNPQQSSLPSSRRVSSSAFVNNLQSLTGVSTSRALTPPHGQSSLSASSSTAQPSQTSPGNASFLQGLSSRLMNSRTNQFPQMSSINRGVGLADIFDAAGMQGIPAGNSFGFRSGQNFGIPTSSGPPSTFDFNEFPSLGGSSTGGVIGGSAPGSNRPNYVGQLVKDQTNSDYNKPAFDMNYNDFPALPGANASSGSSGREVTGSDGDGRHFSQGLGLGGSIGGSSFNSQSGLIGQRDSPHISNLTGSSAITPSTSALNAASSLTSSKQGLQQQKRGIQTTEDGRVTNIPMGMVTDQFGMIGLLTFIRVADTKPNLVSLALGTDLTNLKLDLNSPDPLYSSFPGPWSSEPLKPYEIDYQVPSEYLIHNQIKDKLALIRDKLNRYGEEILFYLFYMFPNDLLQIAASNELFVRDWRYHKDEKIWITRAPGFLPSEKTNTYERGTYYYFDPTTWRRQAKEFHLDYDRLENRPATANFNAMSSAISGPGQITNHMS